MYLYVQSTRVSACAAQAAKTRERQLEEELAKMKSQQEAALQEMTAGGVRYFAPCMPCATRRHVSDAEPYKWHWVSEAEWQPWITGQFALRPSKSGGGAREAEPKSPILGV